jgi:hypothetical protein
MPDTLVKENAHSVSWWLEAASKANTGNSRAFESICRRLMAIEHQDGMETEKPVSRAINHPIGHVAQAVINHWTKTRPQDGAGIPSGVRELLLQFLDTSVAQFRHARVILCAHVILLFRVDSEWTNRWVIPLFDWNTSRDSALAAWDGFLWSPRAYRPLLSAFKGPFLDTANHYGDLDESGAQFAGLLTYIALEINDIFSAAELRIATEMLPPDGLAECAESLTRAFQGNPENRPEYWRVVVKRYWHDVWPKDIERKSSRISDSLARLITEVDPSQIDEALTLFEGWLIPQQNPYGLIKRLSERMLATAKPLTTLKLLDTVISDAAYVHGVQLAECLKQMVQNDETLKADARYRRLAAIARNYGGNPP